MRFPRLVLASLLLLLSASVTSAQDAIDLAQTSIVNAPDVRSWPSTARITRLEFANGVTRITFTKQEGADRWPDVRPAGWDGSLQYTLWLFLQVDGQWVGSGFIQFWHGRDGSGGLSDPDVPSVYHEHWYYAARWAPLYGHGPIAPGERIGFMVTSGNARDSAGPYGPQERSNVVVLSATDAGAFRFDPALPDPLTPAPTLIVDVPPLPTDLAARLEAIAGQLEALRLQADANTAKVQRQIEQVVKNAQKSAAPLVLRILSLGMVH